MDTLDGEKFTYEGDDLESLEVMNRYYLWILEQFSPYLAEGNSCVEFGSGTGKFSKLIFENVDQLNLVEPSTNLFKKLREQYAHNENVELFNVSLEQYLEGAAPSLHDGAILVNVLEHIKDDQLALSGIAKILKSGGYLFLFVPALNILYSKFDKKIGHYRRYQKYELGSLVSNAGFKVISNHYCDVLGVFPWLVVNKIFGRTKLDPNLLKLYDNVGVPLTRAIEKMLVPPFGKNLILVARRSDDNRLAV